MHELLIICVYLPLLPPITSYRPWRVKFTQYMGILKREVCGMQLASGNMDWDNLCKLLTFTRYISSMPHHVAQEVLQAKDGRQIPHCSVKA